jgi:cysteine desulfurase
MIYLDNAATTQPFPEVVDAMLPFLREEYGNPSSLHAAGAAVRHTLEESRSDIARLLGAISPRQILFTSGVTESIALAFASVGPNASQIVTSAVEHSAVLAASRRWANGRPVISIPVDREGLLDMEAMHNVLCKAPSFVSLMLANNETGVLFDIPSAAQLCRKCNAVLHVDAAQAVGKAALNVRQLDCDYLSLSAHKFHGPKGIGALYARRPATVQPIFPGHQESQKRGGTENVPGIVGMAAAARVLADRPADFALITNLRDQLERSITAAIPGAMVNGHATKRIASISNISLPHTSAADFVVQLSRRGLHISAGAACSSGRQPSHVILAMHNDPMRAESSLRFSLSRLTTPEEITNAISIVTQTYHHAALLRFDISV